MQVWTTPMNGTLAETQFPMGVRQQPAYQRISPFSESRRHRSSAAPSVIRTRAGASCTISVPPRASRIDGASRPPASNQCAAAWQSSQ